MDSPTILKLVIIYLLVYEDGTDSVPKRRHIKFRRRGISQKKTYNKYYQEVCSFDSVHPLRLHLDDTSVEISLQPQSYQPSVTAPTVPTTQSYSPTMLHLIEGP